MFKATIERATVDRAVLEHRLLRTRGTRLVSVASCAWVLAGCASLSFERKETFAEWYVGPAGFGGMFHEPREGTDCSFNGGLVTGSPITESRSYVFGHFRIPEVLWQPAGGLDYPERLVCVTEEIVRTIDSVESSSGDGITQDFHEPFPYVKSTHYGKLRQAGAGAIDRHVDFDVSGAGLVDAIVPYRLLRASGDGQEKLRGVAYWPLIVIGNALTGALQGTAYVCHDVVKTLMIPYALYHYQ